MKAIYYLSCLIVALFGLLVNAAEFEYPKPYSVVYVGARETIRYDVSKFTANDTVVFFFDEDRSTTLAYGPATLGNFTFVVPAKAITPEGRNSSTLIGVFRRNFYLWKVYTVPVKVELPPANVTQEQDQP